MSLFEYLVSFRAALIEEIAGVESSNDLYSWDSTRSNSASKRALERLLNKYLSLAKDQGVYCVTRYTSCGSPAHSGYPTEDPYGLSITYQDTRFVWQGIQMYQGPRFSKCPCSPGNKPNENVVIDDFVYDKSANITDCKNIALILEEVHWAKLLCRDKKSRSAIRERLLRALLRINDAILPQSIDSYITTMQRVHKNNLLLE